MIDPQGETWAAVLRWAKEREEMALTLITDPHLDERLTQFHRGRISLIRELQALPKDLLDKEEGSTEANWL